MNLILSTDMSSRTIATRNDDFEVDTAIVLGRSSPKKLQDSCMSSLKP